MKISIIVSTYNRPDALSAVMLAFENQMGDDPSNWELLIADDGSSDETKVVIDGYRNKFQERLKHVWHPDLGFRLAEIRNLAVTKADGDYFVFLDGDCIPMPDFILKHRELAEKGWVVAGNRILFSDKFTSQLLSSDDPIIVCRWSVIQWFTAKLRGNVNSSIGWVRLNLTRWRQHRACDWKLLRGCNIGIWRNDLIKVNGFDAEFSGWGYEDSDLAVRLLRSGIRLKDGRFAVPVLHLWHKENDRSAQVENWEKFKKSLENTSSYAVKGLQI